MAHHNMGLALVVEELDWLDCRNKVLVLAVEELDWNKVVVAKQAVGNKGKAYLVADCLVKHNKEMVIFVEEFDYHLLIAVGNMAHMRLFERGYYE